MLKETSWPVMRHCFGIWTPAKPFPLIQTTCQSHDLPAQNWALYGEGSLRKGAFHQELEWEGLPWGGEAVVKTLCFHARCTGSIPGWEAKIPHALWCSQKHFFIKKINKTTGVGYTGHLVKGMKFWNQWIFPTSSGLLSLLFLLPDNIWERTLNVCIIF